MAVFKCTCERLKALPWQKGSLTNPIKDLVVHMHPCLFHQDKWIKRACCGLLYECHIQNNYES